MHKLPSSRFFFKLALALLAFCSALRPASAQSPIGLLSCTPTVGTAFSVSLYAFDNDEAYFGYQDFSTLSAAATMGQFPQCTLTNGDTQIVYSSVSFRSPELDVAGPGVLQATSRRYTEAIFDYEGMSAANLPRPDPQIGQISCSGSGLSFTYPLYRMGLTDQYDNTEVFTLDLDVSAIPDLDTIHENLFNDYTCNITAGTYAATLQYVNIFDGARMYAAGQNVLDSSAHLFARAILYSFLSSTGAVTGPSVEPTSTLSCQNPNYSTPLYAVSVTNISQAQSFYAEILLDAAQLAALGSATSHSSCSFALGNKSVTASKVQIGAALQQGEQGFGTTDGVFFTQARMDFSNIVVDGITFPGTLSSSSVRGAEKSSPAPQSPTRSPSAVRLQAARTPAPQ
jgi:hypothetical protein